MAVAARDAAHRATRFAHWLLAGLSANGPLPNLPVFATVVPFGGQLKRLANLARERQTFCNFAGVLLDKANVALERLPFRSEFKPLPLRTPADELSGNIAFNG